MEKGNINEYLLKTQKQLFEILCDIDEVCRKYKIKYSLDSGTLLGAVRGNTFIPWDDDADIIMAREEFERFYKIYNSRKDSKFTMERELWVYRIGNKLEGNNAVVDIFILDNVPDSYFKQELKLIFIKILQGMLKQKPNYNEYSTINKVLSFILFYFGKLFTDNKKFYFYNKVSKIGNSSLTGNKWAYNYSFQFLNKKISSNIVKKYLDINFNNKSFQIFSDYDNFLKNIYGDNYMQPPPVEKRIPKHYKNKTSK
jgi:lipopolysaccharide cholinephosphotransferase